MFCKKYANSCRSANPASAHEVFERVLSVSSAQIWESTVDLGDARNFLVLPPFRNKHCRLNFCHPNQDGTVGHGIPSTRKNSIIFWWPKDRPFTAMVDQLASHRFLASSWGWGTRPFGFPIGSVGKDGIELWYLWLQWWSRTGGGLGIWPEFTKSATQQPEEVSDCRTSSLALTNM